MLTTPPHAAFLSSQVINTMRRPAQDRYGVGPDFRIREQRTVPWMRMEKFGLFHQNDSIKK